MCGVSGGFALTDDRMIDAGIVRAMNHHQRLRGPDGEGLWTSRDGRIALGHRRLALIDLSSAGAQPMLDATGRYAISFNGEIYNHAALRKELEKLGRRFVTACDTEVLLNAFAEWGEDCLHRLRGMFALAIYDTAERALWLARDPFGVKPLYFSQAHGRIWFASQARALVECAPLDARRDPAGLVGFYLLGYVPEPFSWWAGVTPLPAGHILKVEAGKSVPAPRAYSLVEEMIAAPAQARMSDEAMRNAFADSVRSHLVADAPVGVFLSAGVDSTAIATIAADCGSRLRTVTLAFDEYRGSHMDEAPLAETTARAIGAEHRTVRLSRDEFFGLVDEFFAAMDQPTTDGLNTFLVSRAAAAAGLKAALSGLGGDEIFGGYPSFTRIPKLLALAKATPLRDRLCAVCERLGAPVASALGLNPKLASILRYCGDLDGAYFLSRALRVTRELELLLDRSVLREGLERLGLGKASAPRGDASLHSAISALELTRYMRNQPLRDTDWSSMANSLEVRVPFLDTTFFRCLAPQLASGAPPTKADLARACGPIVSAAAARPKTGFTTPVDGWLRKPLKTGARSGDLRAWSGRVGAAFRFLPPAPCLTAPDGA